MIFEKGIVSFPWKLLWFWLLKSQLPVSTIPVIVSWIVIVSSIENACIATLLWVELDLFWQRWNWVGTSLRERENLHVDRLRPIVSTSIWWAIGGASKIVIIWSCPHTAVSPKIPSQNDDISGLRWKELSFVETFGGIQECIDLV